MNNDVILKKAGEVAARIIEGEAVIVSPSEGEVRVLNEVGSRIWELVDGNSSVGEIIELISSEFDVTREIATKDTLEFCQEFEAIGLLVR